MQKKTLLTIAGAVFTLIGPPGKLHALDMFIEGKGAYFHPTSKTFRQIYPNRGIYGLEYTCQAWKGVYAWASADFYRSQGHSIGLHNRTTLYFIPIGLGLKFLYRVGCAQLYLGAGILPTYMHIHSHSDPFIIEASCRWVVGGVGKAGVLFNLPKSFIIDLFTNYSAIGVRFHHTDHGKIMRRFADVSGWSIGLGIGYRFGEPIKYAHRKGSGSCNYW